MIPHKVVVMLIHFLILTAVLWNCTWVLFSGVYWNGGRYLEEVEFPLAAFWPERHSLLAYMLFPLPLYLLILWIIWLLKVTYVGSGLRERLKWTYIGLLFYLFNVYYGLGGEIFKYLLRGRWDNNLSRPADLYAPVSKIIHLEDQIGPLGKLFILPLARLFTLGWHESAILLFAFVWTIISSVLVGVAYKLFTLIEGQFSSLRN